MSSVSSITLILRNFKISEFDCKHTGENRMNPWFLSLLDALRNECSFPFVITSGYRSPKHPIEAAKDSPGTHAQGIAADIRVRNGTERMLIVKNALKLGFSGIGVAKDFVHVDTRETSEVMWVY